MEATARHDIQQLGHDVALVAHEEDEEDEDEEDEGEEDGEDNLPSLLEVNSIRLSSLSASEESKRFMKKIPENENKHRCRLLTTETSPTPSWVLFKCFMTLLGKFVRYDKILLAEYAKPTARKSSKSFKQKICQIFSG
jgi:hypothetical protein